MLFFNCKCITNKKINFITYPCFFKWEGVTKVQSLWRATALRWDVSENILEFEKLSIICLTLFFIGKVIVIGWWGHTISGFNSSVKTHITWVVRYEKLLKKKIKAKFEKIALNFFILFRFQKSYLICIVLKIKLQSACSNDIWNYTIYG